MNKDSLSRPYRLYWGTWIVLLLLTTLMLLLDVGGRASALVVGILLLAMLGKAALIGANFMHLRFESRALTVTVAVGLLLTAMVLFLLIAVDGVRVRELADHY